MGVDSGRLLCVAHTAMLKVVPTTKKSLGEPSGCARAEPSLAFARRPKGRILDKYKCITDSSQARPLKRTGPSASEVKALAKRAVGRKGYARTSVTSHKWDVSGSCQEPKALSLNGRVLSWERDSKGGKPGDASPSFMDMLVPCRKCTACLAWRTHMWTERASLEIVMSKRTWLGTLTLSPDRQENCANLARMRERKNGYDFDALPTAEQFAQRHRFAQMEVTRWLKRLRFSGYELRYMLVCEAHKSGLPHYHILLHELMRPISVRTLQSSWGWGFSAWKVVSKDTALETAQYVCKYLTKDTKARVRASVGYGLLGQNQATVGAGFAKTKKRNALVA